MTAVSEPTLGRPAPAAPASRPRLAPAELLPWLAVVGFALQGLRPLSDPDTWWHLRAGQWILWHQRLPTTDHWSFASTKPWVAHEWLSEVLLYLGYRAGGYQGVLVLRALVLAAIAFVVVRECRRRSGWLHTTIAALFGLATVEPGAAARPQLASFLVMAIFGAALLRAVQRRRPPVWLIAVVWLWANLHGLWTLGLLLYAAVTVGLAIHVRGRDRSMLAGFAGVGAAMLGAAALTPNGPKLLLTPFAVSGVTRYVTEWQAPHITSLPTTAALVLLTIVVISWARSRRLVPAYEMAYVFVAAAFALAVVRTGPLAGVLLAPLAAAALAELFREPATTLRLTRGLLTSTALVAAATVAVSAVWLSHVPAIQAPAAPAASRVIDELPGRPRVLTEFDLGNWMLWTARDALPALDGRYEIFGPHYLRRYVSTLNMHGDWRGFVAASKARAAWLHVDVPLAGGLKDKLHWTVAWTDGKTVILVRPAGATGSAAR